MWAAVSASVIGTSHEAMGTPCQDNCQVVQLRTGGEDLFVAAIADGAGSASHAEIGSKEAVQHLLKLVSEAELDPGKISQETVRGWFNNVLKHLESIAKSESVPLKELSCTLLLGIAWKAGALFGQIGDGGWVVEKDGEIVTGTWPEETEYINVVTFLTTDGAIDGLQFKLVEGNITGVAGFTDGIQSLVLNYAQRVPHAPFFNEMFAPLRSDSDASELNAPLRQFLASAPVVSRTDDDKSLVLAVWREPRAERNGSNR